MGGWFPPGAPLLTQALDACPGLLASTGHRGNSSCTWCVDACGVAVAGCLVVPHVPVSWGVPQFSHACSWA